MSKHEKLTCGRVRGPVVTTSAESNYQRRFNGDGKVDLSWMERRCCPSRVGIRNLMKLSEGPTLEHQSVLKQRLKHPFKHPIIFLKGFSFLVQTGSFIRNSLL